MTFIAFIALMIWVVTTSRPLEDACARNVGDAVPGAGIGDERTSSRTYGHVVSDSEEYLRGLLDSFDRTSLAKAEAAR